MNPGRSRWNRMWSAILSPTGLTYAVPIVGYVYLQIVGDRAVEQPLLGVTIAFVLVPCALLLHRYMNPDPHRRTSSLLPLPTLLYVSATVSLYFRNQPGLEWVPLMVSVAYILYTLRLIFRAGFRRDEDGDEGGGDDGDDPTPEPVTPPRERASR